MTTPAVPDDDALVFAEDPEPSGQHAGVTNEVWRVLVVDDDKEVHAATRFALDGVEMQGRFLHFLHAYSAAEARAVLSQERDIAVILLDVVMEREDAGLQLARHIREELQLSELRIILRTGQPGYAPELESIRNYDINDYKTKSELTRTKLFTAITSAIRCYQQIHAINASRRGLEMIVHASTELMAQQGLENFAAGVITQIAGLLSMKPEGVLCVRERTGGDPGDLLVIAAAGEYRGMINKPLSDIRDPRIVGALTRSIESRTHAYGPDFTVLHFNSEDSKDFAAFLDTGRAISEIDKRLLEVFCRNVSVELENVLLVSRLRDIAFSDALTALPNRRSLVDLIQATLASEDRASATLALVDIDHFSEINDAIGHPFGDRLLLAVAERLRAEFGPEVHLARASGDTFALLGASHGVHPGRIRMLFDQPFSVDGQNVLLSATIGLVHLQDCSGNGVSALRDADIALKKAKSQQRNGHVYYAPSMGDAIRERVQMIAALRTGFELGELFVVYQPQVDLKSRRTTGAEALLRWTNRDGTVVPPDRFIPIAEYSGLIIDIGEWVLRQALVELAGLRKLGFTDFTMSVNVSIMQFRHPQFLAMLDRALAEAGVPPQFVELEITESVAMDEPQAVIALLGQIKQRGVRIAIDDFGTGFSSLSYLQQLNADRLKIDRAFVTEIGATARGGRIADMVVRLGQGLEINVIAEGVETEHQAATLLSLGCPSAQGYLFARPMTPEALQAWLNGQHGSRQG